MFWMDKWHFLFSMLTVILFIQYLIIRMSTSLLWLMSVKILPIWYVIDAVTSNARHTLKYRGRCKSRGGPQWHFDNQLYPTYLLHTQSIKWAHLVSQVICELQLVYSVVLLNIRLIDMIITFSLYKHYLQFQLTRMAHTIQYQWSYCSLALSHLYIGISLFIVYLQSVLIFVVITTSWYYLLKWRNNTNSTSVVRDKSTRC